MALLCAAVIVALAIAWVDSRPHWHDSGVSDFALMIAAGVFALIAPERAWRWGLAIGVWIPLFLIAHLDPWHRRGRIADS